MRGFGKFAAILTIASLIVSMAIPVLAAEEKKPAAATPKAKAVSGAFTGSTPLSQYLYGKFSTSPATISVPTSKIGGDDYAKSLFQKLGDAAEEAFIQNGMMDHITGLSYSYNNGSTVTLNLKYADKKAENRKLKTAALSAKTAEIIAATITADMTDAQKAAALYNYVSSNVSYDYSALNDYIEKDTGANFYVKQTAYSGLVNGKAICQGFAKSYKLLCDKAGVPCVAVFGTTKRADTGVDISHAWNRVYLDGAWHTVDTSNRQLNICAQNGIIIPAATAQSILRPNKQWLVDKELAKFG